jgi:hypothetical protein
LGANQLPAGVEGANQQESCRQHTYRARQYQRADAGNDRAPKQRLASGGARPNEIVDGNGASERPHIPLRYQHAMISRFLKQDFGEKRVHTDYALKNEEGEGWRRCTKGTPRAKFPGGGGNPAGYA